MSLSFNKYKRMLSAALACVMLLGLTPSVLAEQSDEGADAAREELEISEYCNLSYEECASSAAGRLFVHKDSGRFCFEDTAGARWYSNPDMGDADSGASGVYRMELQSLLIVHYYDAASDQFKKANTETSCVRSGGSVKVNLTDNGFEAVYDFALLDMVIPVSITLDDKGVSASVDCTAIEENSPDKYMLYRISLLPYFGAGASDEQGYIMVADGSGCIMNFNNGSTTKLGYSSHIYGDDVSKYLIAKPAASYPIMLPVFGIKKGSSAVTAIVTDGAAQGTVWCYPNKSITSYANVYTAFDLRETDTVVLSEDTNSSQSATVYQKTDINLKRIAVSYYSLTGEDADYNGMAQCYKSYLTERDGIKTGAQNIGKLSLDFYGAVKKDKSILGFPVTVNQATSKLEDIEDVINELYEDGISDISVTLRRWSREQLSGKIDYSMKPVSVIGDKKELNSLADALAENGGRLNLEVSVNAYKKSGKGYFTWFNSAKSLSNAPIYSYEFYISNFKKNTSLGRYSFLIPTYIGKMADGIIEKSAMYQNAQLSLGSFSTTLYSDFSKKRVYNLEDTKRQFDEAAESFDKVAMDTPADYVIKNTSLAQKIPSSSTGSDIFDEDIPFVQLVLSGITPYTSEAVNLSAEPAATVLEAAATGSCLQFDLITEDAYSVVGTAFDELYNSEAELLYDRILEYAEYFAQMNELLGDSVMMSYKKDGDVSVSTYSSGAAVTVDRATGSVKTAGADGRVFEFTLQ